MLKIEKHKLYIDDNLFQEEYFIILGDNIKGAYRFNKEEFEELKKQIEELCK